MKPKLYLLLLFCGITASARSQTKSSISNVGDAAPPLRVGQWLKGTPVRRFEKGRVYILEFWATWCMPCMASMPHLSAVAKTYSKNVTVVALDVHESDDHVSLSKIKAIVARKKDTMNFAVATEDPRFTIHDWLEKFDEKKNGIPETFVVDGAGKVAWIGEPYQVERVLPQIINHSWEVNKELKRRKAESYLKALDTQVMNKVNKVGLGSDSSLVIINAMLKKEPKLKFAQFTGSDTFAALLHTDPKKAYAFGEQALKTPLYDMPLYGIRDYDGKTKLPPYIYRLGAESYQALIDRDPYPLAADMPARYRKMATWYKKSGNNAKATWAESKAAGLSQKK